MVYATLAKRSIYRLAPMAEAVGYERFCLVDEVELSENKEALIVLAGHRAPGVAADA